VGALYWTVPGPDVVNSGQEDRIVCQSKPGREFCLPVGCVALYDSRSAGTGPG